MTDDPRAPRGWEGLARDQARWLYTLARLLALGLVAALGQRLL